MSLAIVSQDLPPSALTEILQESERDRDQLFAGQEFCEREMRDWWVFYTKSRQEKALSQHLRARHIPHFLPLYKKHTVCRGRRFTSLLPLFGGYLFLFADRDERVTALESNRVARTIEVPDWRAGELCRDLIQIKRLIDSGMPLTVESRIEPGQLVRVRKGSRLAGLEGIVTKRRGGSRLLIAVNYLQQGASIEIDDFAVEIV
jgi:hypothetical protein